MYARYIHYFEKLTTSKSKLSSMVRTRARKGLTNDPNKRSYSKMEINELASARQAHREL